MKKRSSKTLPSKPPTSFSAGDAGAALELVRVLQREGFTATAVRVGEVSIELAIVMPRTAPASASPEQAAPPTKTPVEEWGGPEVARLLAETEATVIPDDDDQPAVRS